jgi:hypothetical protein
VWGLKLCGEVESRCVDRQALNWFLIRSNLEAKHEKDKTQKGDISKEA